MFSEFVIKELREVQELRRKYFAEATLKQLEKQPMIFSLEFSKRVTRPWELHKDICYEEFRDTQYASSYDEENWRIIFFSALKDVLKDVATGWSIYNITIFNYSHFLARR